jgi:hypothetical protein
MDCGKIKLLFDDFIHGGLTEQEENMVKTHLDTCQECKNDFLLYRRTLDDLAEIPYDTPGGLNEKQFLEFLEKEKIRINKQAKVLWTPVLKKVISLGIAASIAMFVIGFIGGREITRNHTENEQIIALRKEIQETKNLMILNMLKQSSASKRIMAVNFTEELEIIQPEVTEALLLALDNDKSENVRLAALDALTRYAWDSGIRSRLVKSLEKQKDPVIKVNMINLMINLNEKSSVPILKKIIEDNEAYESVREQARKGLSVLL